MIKYDPKQAKIECITYCKQNKGCYGEDGSCDLSSDGKILCEYLDTKRTAKKMMYTSATGRQEYTLFGCDYKIE